MGRTHPDQTENYARRQEDYHLGDVEKQLWRLWAIISGVLIVDLPEVASAHATIGVKIRAAARAAQFPTLAVAAGDDPDRHAAERDDQDGQDQEK